MGGKRAGFFWGGVFLRCGSVFGMGILGSFLKGKVRYEMVVFRYGRVRKQKLLFLIVTGSE